MNLEKLGNIASGRQVDVIFLARMFLFTPSYDCTCHEIQYKGTQSGLKSYEMNTTSESEEKDSIMYTYVDLHLLFSLGRHLCSIYEHVPKIS